MPFEPAHLRALLAACAAALLVQALPARASRLLDQALAHGAWCTSAADIVARWKDVTA